MSQPLEIHQRMLGRVGSVIYNCLKGKTGVTYFAPFDVRLIHDSIVDRDIITVVQPDICVICDPKKIDEKGGIGTPDIMVEILSPGNNKTELQNKYEIYEEAGVKEYWIISPYGKIFFRYILDENKKFQPTKLSTLGDEVTSPILPNFALNLDEVFADRLGRTTN